jgi:hypothetical protein
MGPKDEQGKNQEKPTDKNFKNTLNKEHLGSSNAFEETENPLSRDADNISDEKLDDMLGD